VVSPKGDARIGCVGWAYRDWVGTVYPRDVAPMAWLETYTTLFNTAEIDATYHALPNDQTVRSWIDQTRNRPGFTFTVTAPHQLAERALATGRFEEARTLATAFRAKVLEPLEKAQRLGAVLLRLPATFALYEAAGDRSALELLSSLLALLEPLERRVAVEFTNGSWYEHVGERLVPEVLEALTGEHVACVQLDGPTQRFTQSRTVPWTYARLRGRRTHIPPSERSLSDAPFNYRYTRDEIGNLAAHIRSFEQRDDTTFVFLENHPHGHSAHNAMDLLESLGRARPRPAVAGPRRTSLDDFGAR
jgi:uncharacterized protein YecE (DUF72 family)